jgi:hypothetical protein
MEEKVLTLLEKARLTHSAVDWDLVEEISAHLSHKNEEEKFSNFEEYCKDNPDALECRIYDV